MTKRMAKDQEQGLRILDTAIWRIARRGECDYYDCDEKSRPKPCDCPRCVALVALEESKSWRFYGSHHDRTESGHFPRETKMHAAWMKLAVGGPGRDPDVLLGEAILKEDKAPSARDWYVATSVIQWLATNVGMTVLEAAGFKYSQWEQDAAAETFRRRQENEEINKKLRDQKETKPENKP